ncbi:MAG: hypothetical protein R2708_29125 [Vicinamibacterales bacterium]
MSPPSLPPPGAGAPAIFEALGFTPHSGGQWRRESDGRTWRLSFRPQRRTKYYGEVRTRQTQGWRLRVDTTTSVPVRAYAVRRGLAQNGLMRRIYRWRGFQHLPLSAPADRFEMITSDAEWVRRLLAAPDTFAAFAALAEYREQAGQAASVYFDPQSLHYASPLWQPSDLTSERVTAVLGGLESLAAAADRLPPPARPSRLTAVETLLRANPWMAAVAYFAIAMAVLGGLGLGLVALAIGAIMLLR